MPSSAEHDDSPPPETQSGAHKLTTLDEERQLADSILRKANDATDNDTLTWIEMGRHQKTAGDGDSCVSLVEKRDPQCGAQRPSTRPELEVDIQRLETEMVQAGQSRDFAKARQKQEQLDELVKLREQMPLASELVLKITAFNQKVEDCIEARKWDEAEAMQQTVAQLECQLSRIESTETSVATSTTEAEGKFVDSAQQETIFGERQWSAQQRSRSSDSNSTDVDAVYVHDSLTVLQAGPLVYLNAYDGNFYPLDMPDFEHEKRVLSAALKDAHAIGKEIEVVYEAATANRLGAFLTTGVGPVLHISGHGHPDFLAIENEGGAMQALMVDELREFVAAGSGKLKVVFVAACHSRKAGEAFVAAGVPHVVCCHFETKLRDLAAIEFARYFYMALSAGFELKYSFDYARQAVLVSPIVEDSRTEMNKFLLLPEKPDGDPYHNVPVFYCDHTPRKKTTNQSKRILPSPPELFIGRELTMYQVLEKLRHARLVRVTGPQGIGKVSLAKAVCKYVEDRIRTFFFEDIYWIDNHGLFSGVRGGEVFCFLRDDNSSKTDAYFRDCCEKTIAALHEKHALIFLDAQEMKSAETINMFLGELLRGTKHTKVVLVCLPEQEISSQRLCVDVKVVVPPLTLRSSVELFGRLCSFVSQCRCSIAHTPVELADLLVPEAHADATAINKSMSMRCAEIYSLVGEGNPARIISCSTKMTGKEFDNLIRIGMRPEFQGKIESRAELENEFSVLSEKQALAAKLSDYQQAQEVKDTLSELEKLRENLPTLTELKQREARFCHDLQRIVSRKNFVEAANLQEELDALRKQISIEEKALLRFGCTSEADGQVAEDISIRSTLLRVPPNIEVAKSKDSHITLVAERDSLALVKHRESVTLPPPSNLELTMVLKALNDKVDQIHERLLVQHEQEILSLENEVLALRKKNEEMQKELLLRQKQVVHLERALVDVDGADDNSISWNPANSDEATSLSNSGAQSVNVHSVSGHVLEEKMPIPREDKVVEESVPTDGDENKRESKTLLNECATAKSLSGLSTQGESQEESTVSHDSLPPSHPKAAPQKYLIPIARYNVVQRTNHDNNSCPFSLVISQGSVVDFSYPTKRCAIVCASNESCFPQIGCVGVVGAIDAAGGPDLRKDIANLPILSNNELGAVRCKTGSAKIVGTSGSYGNLHVPYVIFAVGPYYYEADGQKNSLLQEDALLRSAYRSSLELAKEKRLEAVAFSLLSAGNRAGGDATRPLRVGVQAIRDFAGYDELKEIHLCAYASSEVDTLKLHVKKLGLQEKDAGGNM